MLTEQMGESKMETGQKWEQVRICFLEEGAPKAFLLGSKLGLPKQALRVAIARKWRWSEEARRKNVRRIATKGTQQIRDQDKATRGKLNMLPRSPIVGSLNYGSNEPQIKKIETVVGRMPVWSKRRKKWVMAPKIEISWAEPTITCAPGETIVRCTWDFYRDKLGVAAYVRATNKNKHR